MRITFVLTLLLWAGPSLTAAVAAPTLSISRTFVPGKVDWTVSVTPDPDLLAGGEGSMAVELAFEFRSSMTLVGAPAVDPLWNEVIDGILIENPGNNPYTGSVTNGVAVYSDVPSQLGRPYSVNAIFASLGSAFFDTPGAKPVLTFTTNNADCTLFYGGVIAQDEDGDLAEVSGQRLYHGAEDPNRDGAITGADINVIVANFGNVGPIDCFLLGDANGDFAVTGADINVVIANFGNVSPGGLLTGAPVPEPKTILTTVVLVGLAVLLRAHQGRRTFFGTS